MATVIPFLTGNMLSDEVPLEITPGTAVVDLTAEEQNAKYRVWSLTAAADPANLPPNNYRGFFCVDNSASTQDAYLVQDGITVRTIPAGSQLELWRPMTQIGNEEFSIVMAGTTVNACIVTERSYI